MGVDAAVGTVILGEAVWRRVLEFFKVNGNVSKYGGKRGGTWQG
jgi:hypothetical protein